ncbi:uncharacterized protein LOC111282680 [Durio zibethinus]|uniref:Uncharacterized protein LOC111282680 n=1 Tax=Durio zibethinus TaxID=66656 RepID=A0A6P5XFZ1_DURZI|nr:uncharacterized protein LOC111282680 [Durio zibethinus]
MARTNKYSSINFNHVLEKNLTSSSSNNSQTHHQNQSSFPSYSSISSHAKTHGRMLVLTRTSPKPISNHPIDSSTPPKQPQARSALAPDQTPLSNLVDDQISLRPLGRTGSVLSVPDQEKEVISVSGSSKPDRFVPPHLRPGFVGKEEKLQPEVFLKKEHKHFGSGGRYSEDGRPKSSGYEKIRKGGESDLNLISRARSSGNRPSSSG